MDQITQILGSIGSIIASVTQRGSKGALAVEVLDAAGNQITAFNGGLFIPESDDMVITYDASNNPIQVVYSFEDAVVATETITYDGSNPVHVHLTRP